MMVRMGLPRPWDVGVCWCWCCGCCGCYGCFGCCGCCCGGGGDVEGENWLQAGLVPPIFSNPIGILNTILYYFVISYIDT